jgi:hypothetical protein
MEGRQSPSVPLHYFFILSFSKNVLPCSSNREFLLGHKHHTKAHFTVKASPTARPYDDPENFPRVKNTHQKRDKLLTCQSLSTEASAYLEQQQHYSETTTTTHIHSYTYYLSSCDRPRKQLPSLLACLITRVLWGVQQPLTIFGGTVALSLRPSKHSILSKQQ